MYVRVFIEALCMHLFPACIGGEGLFHNNNNNNNLFVRVLIEWKGWEFPRLWTVSLSHRSGNRW